MDEGESRDLSGGSPGKTLESGQPVGSMAGLMIVDAATLLAGPLAASLLGDLGAEVIKVELPGRGDPLRGYPPFKNGVSLIHKVTNRNKKAVTLDFRLDEGHAVFVDLVSRADVVVLNFRPGTLEKWRLTHAELAKINPRIITLQVSAFGATGPYRDRPGFARIAEAFSGLAGVTGYPNSGPILAGYPIVDAVTGLFGSFSILAALRERDKTGKGSLIDLALYEPLLRLMEDLVIPVQFGSQRSRLGNANPFVAPNDMYVCKDGHYVVLPISTDGMFVRLARAMGREDLLDEFASNAIRVERREEVDVVVREFVARQNADELVEAFAAAELPVGKIYSPEEILTDPHIQERGNLIEIYDDECDAQLTMQAPLPLGSGQIRHAGRRLGADNDEVYGELLGYSKKLLAELRAVAAI